MARSDASLEKNLTCSICMEIFPDPVTTPCGHSFCRRCLELSISPYQETDMCPLCKKCLNKALDVNIVLRDIAQQMKSSIGNRSSAAAGEILCDVCKEPKQKATRSCLLCLASYCSDHLENHSTERFKGHKLVEPVENLDERACLIHGRPLELYNSKQQKCICVQCLEGCQDEVVSSEEEWLKKKTQLDSTKKVLEDRITIREKKMVEIDKALKECKDLIDNEWWDIDSVFTALTIIVETAQKKALEPLQDKRDIMEKEAKQLEDELKAEINKIKKTISELNDISLVEDHILFLQDDLKDWTDVELDTTLSFGSMREMTTAMVKNVKQELKKLDSTELKRLPKFSANIKLDPKTAHKRLVVSPDGKEVRDGGENREVNDFPKRFDVLGSILGLNSLSTGKSYWEVEVSDTTGWDLGLARGSANRRGRPTLNPDNGYWVLVHFEESDVPKPFAEYAVMTNSPTCLSLKHKPKKVGVFVDYQEGLISFYDVLAQSHIYSFSKCSFQDELYPYFSLHMKYEVNFEPLIISKIIRTNIHDK